MFISLVRPSIDYCSQVWGPCEDPVLDSLEKVLKDFSKLIPEIRNFSYEERLKRLNLHSIQRRFDRYRVIYMKKIQLGLVPNPGVVMDHTPVSRNGATFKVPDKNLLTNEWSSMSRKESFQYRGPKLFNSIDNFKSKFYEYLSLIPDNPRLGNIGVMYINN